MHHGSRSSQRPQAIVSNPAPVSDHMYSMYSNQNKYQNWISDFLSVQEPTLLLISLKMIFLVNQMINPITITSTKHDIVNCFVLHLFLNCFH